jgi:hypothetical protein
MVELGYEAVEQRRSDALNWQKPIDLQALFAAFNRRATAANPAPGHL